MVVEKNQDVEKLVELVKDIRTCMLITHGQNGEDISGRPMGINTVDADGTMWFFTKKSSLKADELEENNRASVAIINESSNTYLMINGNANLIFHRQKMEELWSPLMKVWFPKGIDDPDIVLIKMTPHEVSYWDGSASKMVVLFNMLKSFVTGKTYDEGEHGTITL